MGHHYHSSGGGCSRGGEDCGVGLAKAAGILIDGGFSIVGDCWTVGGG